MKNKKVEYIVIPAVFAAIIAVFTAFIKINIGMNGGYIHLGDSIIYICASILPAPCAIWAAAIGGAMADLLAGAPAWAIPTAIIKALNVVPFVLVRMLGKAKQQNKILTKTTVLMPLPSALVTVFGYLLAGGILYSFPTALASVPFNMIQAVGSTLLFYIAGSALDKMNFRKMIHNIFEK